MIPFNAWIIHVEDICEECGTMKASKFGMIDDEMRVVVSCGCETCIFGREWMEAYMTGRTIQTTASVNSMIDMLASIISERKERT